MRRRGMERMFRTGDNTDETVRRSRNKRRFVTDSRGGKAEKSSPFRPSWSTKRLQDNYGNVAKKVLPSRRYHRKTEKKVSNMGLPLKTLVTGESNTKVTSESRMNPRKTSRCY